jgi:hypothetical protein
MRATFESKLSTALEKALTDNGINPNGGELGRITASVLVLLSEELEVVASDPEELSKVQASAKAKKEKLIPSQPAQTWRRRWNPPQSPAEKTDAVQGKPPAPPAPAGNKMLNEEMA